MDDNSKKGSLYSYRKSGLILITVILLVLMGISLYTTHNMVNPERLPVTEEPSADYTEVSFSSRDKGLELSGWLIPATEENKYLIFAHGYGSNRTEKINLAEKLAQRGYGILLFDFRNSGQSEKDITSIGLYEKKDLLGAIDYIQATVEEKPSLGLIGFSMGAATSALAAAEAPEIKAVVMDSSFADLKPYLEENLPLWSDLPAFPFNWLILNLATPLWNLDPREVRPIEAVTETKTPILFIHGKTDGEIPFQNSQKLYRTSNTPEDRLWLVPEAGHVGAFNIHPDLYLEKVIDFFEDHL